MELKIGVVYTPRELVVETNDDGDSIAKKIDDALGGGSKMLWLTDTKGRRVGVPSDKIAYIEIGNDESERRVGFGNR
jgi:hypothetical protein